MGPLGAGGGRRRRRLHDRGSHIPQRLDALRHERRRQHGQGDGRRLEGDQAGIDSCQQHSPRRHGRGAGEPDQERGHRSDFDLNIWKRGRGRRRRPELLRELFLGRWLLRCAGALRTGRLGAVRTLGNTTAKETKTNMRFMRRRNAAAGGGGARRGFTFAAVASIALLACVGVAACGGSSSSTDASANAAAAGGAAGATGATGRFAAVRECLQKQGITLPSRPAGAGPRWRLRRPRRGLERTATARLRSPRRRLAHQVPGSAQEVRWWQLPARRARALLQQRGR